jgi:two-component system, NtrC family, sensor kinase
MKNSVLTAKTWMLLSVAALLIAAGALNFSQRLRYQAPPWDGVTWTDTRDGVVVKNIAPNSAAARARLMPGDHLVAISVDDRKYEAISSSSNVPIYFDRAHIGGEIHYLIERPTYPVETRFYYADLENLGSIETWTARDLYLNLIGLVYLCIGLFVIFKQGGRAPFVLHFAAVCLAAYVFHFYTPIGIYKDLDLAVAFLDSAGLILFAPLFLHFSAIYPTRYHLYEQKRWRAMILYIPALLLLLISVGVFLRDQIVLVFPFSSAFLDYSPNFAVTFYKASILQLAVALVASATILIRRFIISKNTVARQQLKWVVWGSGLAIAPFTLLYAVGYILGGEGNTALTNAAVLPLILIPLSFGYSVVRYRLMDVELVVRRAAVYALTTLAISMAIGGVVYLAGLYALSGDIASSGEITLRLIASIAVMALIVMIAAPVKNFLQERVDRLFYGRRYDLRRSLLDFGRTLSATTALEPLLDSLITRLREVLNVERIAIFLEDRSAGAGYRVARTAGLKTEIVVPTDFREMIRTRSAETGVVRADDLELSETTGYVRRELHYYVPCVVRGRMVAVIGLGRSADGALLSSEDVEILRTVSGYVGVAIENSLLYQEQTQRAAELELLKEFNESIVESINAGLLAVDLEGRITHLNSALEQQFSITRDEAVGQNVETLFAEDFADTLRQVLGPDGWRLGDTRQIYKLHTNTRAGRPVVLNIALAPLRSDNGELTGALVMLEDVTQRIDLEEQLQQREKLSSIGLLAAGVAHEVNTPLTGVSSYTQMLLNMLPETDPKHALLQKVRRQSERATEIVNNLLNFSRTGSATEFTDLDIHRVLDDTLQLLEPQLRRSQITIVRDYAPDARVVFGNAVKLQQVFTNLILNARDSIINGDGQILLSTRSDVEDGSLEVEVADNGSGIAPEHVAKIYDPFFTTKGVGGGTGLGLAVTYGIVQEHAGHINVSSAPGQGTIFRITLPTADPRTHLRAAAR